MGTRSQNMNTTLPIGTHEMSGGAPSPTERGSAEMVNCIAVGPKLAVERRAIVRGCPSGRRQSHKYDRYLADVFVTTGDEAFVFLNNALLQAGHADHKDAYVVTDWES